MSTRLGRRRPEKMCQHKALYKSAWCLLGTTLGKGRTKAAQRHFHECNIGRASCSAERLHAKRNIPLRRRNIPLRRRCDSVSSARLPTNKANEPGFDQTCSLSLSLTRLNWPVKATRNTVIVASQKTPPSLGPREQNDFFQNRGQDARAFWGMEPPLRNPPSV